MDVVTRRRARVIREAKGLSLTEAAKAAGINKAQLSRFERAERDLFYEAQRALADFYAVTIGELRELVAVECPE
jgi:transcriptional regulator with XRE-family HTH domain